MVTPFPSVLNISVYASTIYHPSLCTHTHPSLTITRPHTHPQTSTISQCNIISQVDHTDAATRELETRMYSDLVANISSGYLKGSIQPVVNVWAYYNQYAAMYAPVCLTTSNSTVFSTCMDAFLTARPMLASYVVKTSTGALYSTMIVSYPLEQLEATSKERTDKMYEVGM